MSRKNEVWFAGDYAGASMDDFDFYYGYEHTICDVHGHDAECECEEVAWAFVAKHDGKEFDRFPIDGELEPCEALPYGLAMLFSKYAEIPKTIT